MLLDGMEKRVRVLRHGGRAVLRISLEWCEAGCAALAHVRALQELLCAYAESVLYEAAASELEQMVAVGCGYTFLPHRYEVFLEERERVHDVLLTLQTRYVRLGHEPICRSLRMRWSKNGDVQLAIGSEKKQREQPL